MFGITGLHHSAMAQPGGSWFSYQERFRDPDTEVPSRFVDSVADLRAVCVVIRQVSCAVTGSATVSPMLAPGAYYPEMTHALNDIRHRHSR